jgi:hypothetical protein
MQPKPIFTIIMYSTISKNNNKENKNLFDVHKSESVEEHQIYHRKNDS